MMSTSGARIGKSKGHGDQDLGSILLAPLIRPQAFVQSQLLDQR